MTSSISLYLYISIMNHSVVNANIRIENRKRVLRLHPMSNELQISSNLLKIQSSLDDVLDPVKEWFDPVIPTRKDFTSRCGCKMGDSNQNVSMCLLDN